MTAVLFFGSCLVIVLSGRGAQAIEETKFKVIESEGRFELRQYSAHIVAETFVEVISARQATRLSIALPAILMVRTAGSRRSP